MSQKNLVVTTPKVSVVVPAYNEEATIARCLRGKNDQRGERNPNIGKFQPKLKYFVANKKEQNGNN